MAPYRRVVRLFRLQEMLPSTMSVTLITRWTSQLISAEERAVNADHLTHQPPVRRRLLGSALRAYRESAGYELSQAARILDCDRSKVSRIETGQRGISSGELRELLTEYGVPGDEQAALAAIAHHGHDDGWWQGYRDVLSG